MIMCIYIYTSFKHEESIKLSIEPEARFRNDSPRRDSNIPSGKVRIQYPLLITLPPIVMEVNMGCWKTSLVFKGAIFAFHDCWKKVAIIPWQQTIVFLWLCPVATAISPRTWKRIVCLCLCLLHPCETKWLARCFMIQQAELNLFKSPPDRQEKQLSNVIYCSYSTVSFGTAVSFVFGKHPFNVIALWPCFWMPCDRSEDHMKCADTRKGEFEQFFGLALYRYVTNII